MSARVPARLGLALLAVLLLLGSATARAQTRFGPQISHDDLVEGSTIPPIIEVLTMGPGDLLVEKFGHAALCVRWPHVPQRDVCYNYGTTDFRQPYALAWGFVRGAAEFWVEKWPRAQMINHYAAKDRSIWIQTIDQNVLPAELRFEIARKLELDARIENRFYEYDHFDDNCSTRVRDIVDAAFGGKLKAGADNEPGPSFRQYGLIGFAEQTWIQIGADFLVGRDADRQPDGWEAMFLPRRLRAAIADDLGIEPVAVYERKGPPFPAQPSGGEAWVVLFALLVSLPAVATRILRRRQRLGAALSGTVLGLIGLALWGLALLSDLPELRYNEALLLFVPSDLALIFLGPDKRRTYGRVRLGMIVLASLLLSVGLFVQPLWLPILVAFPTMLVCATAIEDRPPRGRG